VEGRFSFWTIPCFLTCNWEEGWDIIFGYGVMGRTWVYDRHEDASKYLNGKAWKTSVRA
jgi:hypothetical protein